MNSGSNDGLSLIILYVYINEFINWFESPKIRKSKSNNLLSYLTYILFLILIDLIDLISLTNSFH